MVLCTCCTFSSESKSYQQGAYRPDSHHSCKRTWQPLISRCFSFLFPTRCSLSPRPLPLSSFFLQRACSTSSQPRVLTIRTLIGTKYAKTTRLDEQPVTPQVGNVACAIREQTPGSVLPSYCTLPLLFPQLISAFVMTRGLWVIWQGITQKRLLCEKINLWKVGHWWSEMPPPALKKKKPAVTLDTADSYPPIFLCDNTDTHLQTQTQSTQRLVLTQICFASLCKHTQTCTQTHTPTPAGRICRVPVLMSNLTVAQRLMKSPCQASAWQVSLTKQIPIYMQRGRWGPCQMLMPGTLWRLMPCVAIFMNSISPCSPARQSSTGAIQLVAVSALASSITPPFGFLSLCPLFLLFIKAPRNNKSPRNWEHVMKS